MWDYICSNKIQDICFVFLFVFFLGGGVRWKETKTTIYVTKYTCIAVLIIYAKKSICGIQKNWFGTVCWYAKHKCFSKLSTRIHRFSWIICKNFHFHSNFHFRFFFFSLNLHLLLFRVEKKNAPRFAFIYI